MSTVNNELAKARKNIKTVAVVFNVVKILAAVITAIAAVACICTLIFSHQVEAFLTPLLTNSDGTFVEELNFLNVHLNFRREIENVNFGIVVSGYFIGFAFVFGVVAIIMEQIYKVLRCIYESESPFTLDAVKKMKVIFIGIIVVVCLTASIPLGFFVGLIEWSIYSIFKYGIALQTESDEIL